MGKEKSLNENEEDKLTKSERKKYELVWKHSDYRNKSPGQGMVEQAYHALGCIKGSSIIDYGCGTGRAAREFAIKGLSVLAIDHAKNCLDDKVQNDPTDDAQVLFAFEQLCLWEIPDMIGAQYAFCADVLEHIPEEKMDVVLSSIATSTSIAAYLAIAMFNDTWYGEKLHMTVRKDWWWKQILGKYMPGASYEKSGGKLFVVWRRENNA